ncbi:MAG: hypothetical protein K0S49_1501 [Microbacterium sp.]|nr:hypothetical protein [Microbacterium sp.]
MRRRRRRIGIVAVLVTVPVLLVTLIVAIGVTATNLAAIPGGAAPPGDQPRALPPNAGDIDPGNLIDDDLFFDRDALSTAEIQDFLDDRIGECVNGACLNVATAGISSRGARVSERTGDVICRAIEGGELPVAEIIHRAQEACGISARVILVTLQKEQSLIEGRAARAPSEGRLRAAMGASCPDTAPCDPEYEGVLPPRPRVRRDGCRDRERRDGGAVQLHALPARPRGHVGGMGLGRPVLVVRQPQLQLLLRAVVRFGASRMRLPAG